MDSGGCEDSVKNKELSICVDNVGILFRRGKGRGSLRDFANAFIGRMMGKAGKLEKKGNTRFWALKGVNLDVKKGETVGIIGDNGSGKSTLLKIISGIYTPSEGRVAVNGRLTALLELGTGFHEELTGRDNVFLYGSILGLKRKEVEKIYDSIVDFAELHRFMDTPLKRYSSGMKVRLGFSVAVHLDPDVLLLDEVLSVGDWKFRQKSLQAMNRKKSEGVTILLVSHNLHEVQSFCTRAILLENGRVVKDGAPGETIDEYLRRSRMKGAIAPGAFSGTGTGSVIVENVRFLDSEGRERITYRTDERVVVEIRVRAEDALYEPVVGLGIFAEDGIRIFGTNTLKLGKSLGTLNEGDVVVVRFHFPQIGISEGSYLVTVICHSQDGLTDYHRIEKGYRIYLENVKGFSGLFDLNPTCEIGGS